MKIFLWQEKQGYARESVRTYEIEDLYYAVNRTSDLTEQQPEFENFTGEEILLNLAGYYKIDAARPELILQELKNIWAKEKMKEKVYRRIFDSFEEVCDLVEESNVSLSYCEREDPEAVFEAVREAYESLRLALPILGSIYERINFL